MAKEAGNESDWRHFDSFSPEQIKQDAADRFDLHPLEIKSLETKNIRPKLLVFSDHIFVRFFLIDSEFELQPIVLFADASGILSFSEHSLPWREDMDKILREGNLSTGHLLYHLFDETVENQLHQMDRMADEIRKIQKTVFDNPFSNDIGHGIFAWRTRIHILRKCLEEEIEVVRKLVRADVTYIDEDSGFYLEDLEDDLMRVVNALDSFQEQLLGVIDLQTSLKADHMNVIMKTLTLVSVIFIPVTFLAGIYGMNFEYMPELKWKYGYLGLWLAIICIVSGIILYFKKRRWW